MERMALVGQELGRDSSLDPGVQPQLVELVASAST